MIQKKKNKKKIGVILCAMFICLCSILCIIPFNKHDKIEVYADEVVGEPIFVGSSLIVPTALYTIGYNNGIRYDSTPYGLNAYDTYTHFDYLNTYFQVSFKYSDNGLLMFKPILNYMSIYGSDNFVSNSGSVGLGSYIKMNYITSSYADYKSAYTEEWLFVDDWKHSNFNCGMLCANSNGPIQFTTNNSIVGGIVFDLIPSFTSGSFDVSKITYMTIGLSAKSRVSTYEVTYFDSNANSIKFRFYCGSWLQSLPLRTYYFNTSALNDNEYYDQGFQQGQQSGYNSGYSEGESVGYNNGYNVGQNVGYNNGYSAGMEDSNQYTFLSLLSATIDAPIKYFQSLFNFELLGVNLQGFLTGLFTLCVIVTIFKLCLGG